MTSTRTTGLIRLLSIVGLAGASLVAGPAQASPPAPGGGGCANVSSVSYPSGKVQFTFRTVCPDASYGFDHGITITDNKGHRVIAKPYCEYRNGYQKSCTKSATIADPAGKQTYEALDNWDVVANAMSGVTEHGATSSGKVTH